VGSGTLLHQAPSVKRLSRRWAQIAVVSIVGLLAAIVLLSLIRRIASSTGY
jgi:hypothetical protein